MSNKTPTNNLLISDSTNSMINHLLAMKEIFQFSIKNLKNRCEKAIKCLGLAHSVYKLPKTLATDRLGICHDVDGV